MAEIYVSASGNDNTGDGSLVAPFASIERAELASTPQDTITLLSNYVVKNSLNIDLDVEVEATLNLNLNGDGFTVSLPTPSVNNTFLEINKDTSIPSSVLSLDNTTFELDSEDYGLISLSSNNSPNPFTRELGISLTNIDVVKGTGDWGAVLVATQEDVLLSSVSVDSFTDGHGSLIVEPSGSTAYLPNQVISLNDINLNNSLRRKIYDGVARGYNILPSLFISGGGSDENNVAHTLRNSTVNVTDSTITYTWDGVDDPAYVEGSSLPKMFTAAYFYGVDRPILENISIVVQWEGKLPTLATDLLDAGQDAAVGVYSRGQRRAYASPQVNNIFIRNLSTLGYGFLSSRFGNHDLMDNTPDTMNVSGIISNCAIPEVDVCLKKPLAAQSFSPDLQGSIAISINKTNGVVDNCAGIGAGIGLYFCQASGVFSDNIAWLNRNAGIALNGGAGWDNVMPVASYQAYPKASRSKVVSKGNSGLGLLSILQFADGSDNFNPPNDPALANSKDTTIFEDSSVVTTSLTPLLAMRERNRISTSRAYGGLFRRNKYFVPDTLTGAETLFSNDTLRGDAANVNFNTWKALSYVDGGASTGSITTYATFAASLTVQEAAAQLVSAETLIRTPVSVLPALANCYRPPSADPLRVEYYLSNTANGEWAVGSDNNTGVTGFSKQNPFLTEAYALANMPTGSYLITNEGVWGDQTFVVPKTRTVAATQADYGDNSITARYGSLGVYAEYGQWLLSSSSLDYTVHISNTPEGSGWAWGDDSNTGVSKEQPINSINKFLQMSTYGDKALLKRGTWDGIPYDSDVIIKRTLTSYIVIGAAPLPTPTNSNNTLVDTGDIVRVIISVEG
jgi:hypothetical protein